MGTRSDIHALIDELAGEKLDAVRRGLAQGEAGNGRSIIDFMKEL